MHLMGYFALTQVFAQQEDLAVPAPAAAAWVRDGLETERSRPLAPAHA